MGNFATARVAALIVALTPVAGAHAGATIPKQLGYTYFVGGQPVGRSDVRVTQTADVLRFESKIHVVSGDATIELSTRTEIDPRTYVMRSFSYQGSKGGQPVSSSITVLGDSAYGWVSMGEAGKKEPHARRVTPGPMIVWEDWVMDLEIVMALQQARASNNSSTRGMILAASYSSAVATLGYTGEVVVESAQKSMAARKLMIGIQGGSPFESLVDPKQGVPVYVHFPGIKAEIFLEEFFGDNPVSRYSTAVKPPMKQ